MSVSTPSGVAAISRGLSAATPPVRRPGKPFDPGGVAEAARCEIIENCCEASANEKHSLASASGWYGGLALSEHSLAAQQEFEQFDDFDLGHLVQQARGHQRLVAEFAFGNFFFRNRNRLFRRAEHDGRVGLAVEQSRRNQARVG